MSLRLLLTLVLLALTPLRAEAEDDLAVAGDDPTDPTEPVTAPALVTLSEPDPADADNDDASTPGDPFGDVGGDGLISLRALFQGRYRTTFAAKSRQERTSVAVREDNLAQQGDGYSLHRLFLRIGSDPSKYVGFKAILDFAELASDDPEDMVKQAYVTLRPIPRRLELMVGLFKRPFSTLELDASARFELADFGETNDLTGALGYGGRDLGAQLLVSPFRKPKRLRLALGAFRGHAHDEHDSPVGAIGARAETKPNKHLRFGADIVQHTKAVTYNRPFNTSSKDELPNPVDPLYPTAKHWGQGYAISCDARYKRKGFMARAEFLYGDRVDYDERYGAETFWAVWGLLAYRIDLGMVRLLPALRYEWLDADREHAGGGYSQLSAGVTVLLWGRVRILVDATRTDVQAGTALLNQPKPLPETPYLALDNTRLTTQLQLEL